MVNPLVTVEEHGIQSCHHLQFILHFAITAPERNTRIVPRRWQDSVLTFRTIDGKIVQRLMMGIVQTYGHDDMTELQVGSLREPFVDPQLLQFHFAAFLLFVFPLSSLIGLILDGRTRTSMLKLDFRAQCPTLSKIIAHVDYSMWDIKLTMTGVVLVILG